jgi:hypothetical protein
MKMDVIVNNGKISEEEKQAYIDHAQRTYPGRAINSLILTLDGDFVDIRYNFAPVKFQRIRRITGYLVGTLDRFNNAKKSEVRDRVKHG